MNTRGDNPQDAQPYSHAAVFTADGSSPSKDWPSPQRLHLSNQMPDAKLLITIPVPTLGRAAAQAFNLALQLPHLEDGWLPLQFFNIHLNVVKYFSTASSASAWPHHHLSSCRFPSFPTANKNIYRLTESVHKPACSFPLAQRRAYVPLDNYIAFSFSLTSLSSKNPSCLGYRA